MGKRLHITLLLLGLLLVSFVSSQGLITEGSTDVNVYTGNLTNLSELQDTNIPTPTDQDILTYDSGTALWISQAASTFSKWIINTTNGFFYTTGGDTLFFNDTLLNDTIDSRAVTSETDPIYTSDNSSIARIGDCPSGQLIQNITTGGVECSAAGAGDITSVQGDDIYIYNGSNSGDVVLVLNETKLNITIDARDSDTTYTAGSNLTLTGTTFALNTSSVITWLDGLYAGIGTIFDGTWASLTGKPTLLSNFTDDLGDRGYTSLSNFTNDPGYITGYNETDPLWTANQSFYSTTSDILVFGYYNSSDFVITDYFTKSDVLAFGYYNSSDFSIGDYSTTSAANLLYAPINYGDDWNKTYADTLYAAIGTEENSSFNQSLTDSLYYSITNPSGFYNSSDFSISDYFTAAEVLAFNYYNSSDFNITDYFTAAEVLGFNYYNSTDFSIGDYYTSTQIDNFAYYNLTDFDISNYYNSTQTDTAIENANTSVVNWVDEFFPRISELVGLIGNWSADKGDYSTTVEADASYYAIGNPSGFYNSTDFIITDYYLASNPANYWNDTFATFNKTYGDTLYAPINYGDDWNKTYADTLYAILGYGDDWNKTYADTLYSDITEPIALSLGNWSADKSDYSTTTEVIAFGYYNSSDFVITDYFTKSDVLGFNYYNATDFSIGDYYTSNQIDTFAYYNASDFNIADYFTATQILGFNYYNSTDFVITDYYTKADINDFGYYNASDFDIANYYTSSQIDGFSYYNSTDFSISDYSTTTQADGLYYSITNPSGFYNSTDFSISDYFTSLQVLGFNYYNASDFSIADYSTTTAASLLYAPINYGDDWNKTYADTLYQPTGSYLTSESDPLWTANQSFYSTKTIADGLYYSINNPSGFYNSSDFSIGDYSTTTQAATLYYSITNPFGFYNSSDFLITNYYTSSQIDGFGYYNTSDFSIADYSTKAVADTLYSPINYGDDWNKTYADTLYADIGVTTTITLPAENITSGSFGTGDYVFDGNVTAEKIIFENDATHYIEDNSTCILIKGTSSTLEIC